MKTCLRMIVASGAMAVAFGCFAEGDVPLWPVGKMPSVQTNQTYAPYLRWFVPERRTTDAILIAVSGGGYGGCGVEGFEVAPMRDYFLRKGMTVVTMRYRCPRPQGLAKHMTAWQDAQRTVRLVRAEAKRRGLDPENIGFTGCSAGGHLAMMVAVSSQTPAYEPVDGIDTEPCHVNWAIPVYPAYLLADGANQHNVRKGNDLNEAFVPELKFDGKTPPMCFFHGDLDGWSSMGSVRAYHKLRTMGVPAELHALALETHCFQSSPRTGTTAANWKDIAWQWLVSLDAVTGHPQSWRGDWRRLAPFWGPSLEATADFAAGSWEKCDWGNITLRAKRDSSLWFKGKILGFALDFECRHPAASSKAAVLIRPVADGTDVICLSLSGLPAGGWNRVTVSVCGGMATVVVNGRPAEGCELGFVPSRETPCRVGLQGSSGVSYRRVRIRENEVKFGSGSEERPGK